MHIWINTACVYQILIATSIKRLSQGAILRIAPCDNLFILVAVSIPLRIHIFDFGEDCTPKFHTPVWWGRPIWCKIWCGGPIFLVFIKWGRKRLLLQFLLASSFTFKCTCFLINSFFSASCKLCPSVLGFKPHTTNMCASVHSRRSQSGSDTCIGNWTREKKQIGFQKSSVQLIYKLNWLKL